MVNSTTSRYQLLYSTTLRWVRAWNSLKRGMMMTTDSDLLLKRLRFLIEVCTYVPIDYLYG